ncbi:hypothetical protein DOY81_003924 [Sarcophaga bullata]|nr:hypothetical protein DOY81_003924 [Sarcophaga bullata]
MFSLHRTYEFNGCPNTIQTQAMPLKTKQNRLTGKHMADIKHLQQQQQYENKYSILAINYKR